MCTRTVQSSIDLQLFDENVMGFADTSTVRLPPPQTCLQASQRYVSLASFRPWWVGQRVRLLNHGFIPQLHGFNADSYDRYVRHCGGLQAAFEFAASPSYQQRAPIQNYGPTNDPFNQILQQLGCPRLGGRDTLWGSPDGASELAIITSIDLHARCALAEDAAMPLTINLTWGTAHVVCFNPVSMGYDGVKLMDVPLYMVHSLGYSAALAEARAGAIAIACQRAQVAAKFDEFEMAKQVFEEKEAAGELEGGGFADASLALDDFRPLLDEILSCTDPVSLASLLAHWGEIELAELVSKRQAEAVHGARMQSMLLVPSLWQQGEQQMPENMQNDASSDPSFHFDPTSYFDRANKNYWRQWWRWDPLLSDYLIF